MAAPPYELFSSTELLGKMAMERMLAGLSTSRYPVGLEPVGDSVEQAATAKSKSAVSRKSVAMTEHALADLLGADLIGLDLVAIMIDGVHFADHLCVFAIDIDGTKHPLALVEGSTENTALVRTLLVGLRERGLDVTKPILAVLDGAKALSAAVTEVFDHPVIARCQIHKLRNVRDHLPEKMRVPVGRRMRAAYHADSALQAEAQLNALARELDKTHPGAAASLREGMAETLTVPPRPAAHPGEDAEVDQRGGVDDLDLPRPRPQRQTLARRTDARAPGSARTTCRRRNCRHRLQHPRRELSLMLTDRHRSSTELGTSSLVWSVVNVCSVPARWSRMAPRTLATARNGHSIVRGCAANHLRNMHKLRKFKKKWGKGPGHRGRFKHYPRGKGNKTHKGKRG